MFDPKSAERVNIMTGFFTGGFVHLEKKWASKAYPDNESYQVTALFQDQKDLIPFEKAVDRVYPIAERTAAFKHPIKSNDEAWKDKPMPEGFRPGQRHIVFKTQDIPQVLDTSMKPIPRTRDVVYSGCIFKASVNSFCYAGGVSFWLEYIIKCADGEKLGGVSAEERFKGVELNYNPLDSGVGMGSSQYL